MELYVKNYPSGYEPLPSENTPITEKVMDNIEEGIYINSSNIKIACPTGEIKLWSTNTPPTGYLICDGSAISRSTYSSLFAIIGTAFGVGNGTSTFNLPNLNGKVPVGKNSAETEFDVLGETGGAKTHTLTINEMPSHDHNAKYGDTAGGDGTGYRYSNTVGNSDAIIENKGGGLAHNNLQPYIVLNYIIKY